MNKEDIENIVLSLLPNANLETRLIGDNSIFDSLGLVSFIVDLETELKNNGVNITIVSEKAMSLNNSPFKTVGTLIDFIWDECL